MHEQNSINHRKKKFFYCYSLNLLRYLKENDMKPIDRDIHPTSKKTMWIFLINNRLDYLLQQWKLINPYNQKV